MIVGEPEKEMIFLQKTFNLEKKVKKTQKQKYTKSKIKILELIKKNLLVLFKICIKKISQTFINFLKNFKNSKTYYF